MRRILILFAVFFGACNSNKTLTDVPNVTYESASTFQLIAPQILADSIFFQNVATIHLELDFPETIIRYTLDGSEVTSSSELYQQPLVIQKTGVIKARAFHPDCQASETMQQTFFKTSNAFHGAAIKVNPIFDSRYAGDGIKSLTDFRKGAAQFRGDENWLGFHKDTVEIQVEFPEKRKLQSLTISTLANEIAWIFLPGEITLLTDNQQIAHWSKANLEDSSKTGLHFLQLDFPETNMDELKIQILSEPLPKGHNGYGGIAWFFIDEIFTSQPDR